MQSEAVKYELLAWPFWLVGGFLGLFTLLILLPATFFILVYGGILDGFNLMVTVMCAGFVAATIYALGLAISRPVALRVDETGISGYFAPSLTWSEIASVEPIRVQRIEAIGICLKDPEAFKESLSNWGLICHALRRKPYDVIVNVRHMRGRCLKYLRVSSTT